MVLVKPPAPAIAEQGRQLRASGLLWQAILLLVFFIAATGSSYASRGGPAGQDILLGPNGMDTKASSEDDVKQDNNQKGGGQKGGGGGGGGGQGGGGGMEFYPFNQDDESMSNMGKVQGSSWIPDGHNAPQFANGTAPSPSRLSGSGESNQNNDNINVSGTSSGTSAFPTVRTPQHPEHAAAPTGHPRDAVQAGLPPCCKDKLPCCSSNWPCCQKAEYHGYTPPGSPSNLPYSQNMQGKDNVLEKGQTNQNQQGQNNNNNNQNANSSSQMSTVTGQMSSEGMSGNPANSISMGPGAAASTQSVMKGTGMSGASGGKMPSSAGMAVTSALNMFNQIRKGQTPGANKEQSKVNQSQEKSVEADNLAGMERDQAATAIEFIIGFMENFTAGGNKFVSLHDHLFLPMAVLLLLPGAVLAQTKAIAAQGFAVLGEVSPWEGITRSIIAIFLIFSSGLILNYGIDVANSLVQTIAQGYSQNFGSNMGSDAEALHVRAHPVRLPEENIGLIPEDIQTVMFNYFGNSQAASMEGSLLAIKYEDPACGLYIVPLDRARECVPYKVPFAREAFNGINCGMAFTWAIMCCVQECYLYYLYFAGPVIAALWVYPSQMLRQAFPNWVEGVVCVCMWSLFWATTVCLMACFRGVDDTGTVACTALLSLALVSVKSAFDFVGLAKEAGRDAARVAEKVGQALNAAKEAKGKGGGPGPGPGPGPG